MESEQEQARLCRQIVAAACDAIIMADREGIIRLWNQGAETIFGFGPTEALGQSLHIIIPENLRARHDEGFHRVMASGRSKYTRELLAVPALRKDGARISVEFTMTLVRDQDGLILGAAAIIREVTARWEKERALQRRLADLEARLFKKGKGKEAKLSFMGHVLMENRHGLIITPRLTTATGTAEREAAVGLVEAVPSRHRITVGADMAYDTQEFVQSLRALQAVPHVAQNCNGRKSAIDGRTTRHPGYAVSQRLRKRVEEIFGWMKTVGNLRKTRHR